MLAIDCRKDTARVLKLDVARDGIRIAVRETLPLAELPAWLGRHRRQEVRVAAVFEKWAHKPLVLPPVREVLPELVAREARHLVGDEVEATFEELELVEEEGEKRVRVLAAAVGRSELEDLARVFEARRVEPSTLTTTPLALRALLEQLGELGPEPVALLSLDGAHSSLAIYKEREIRVLRALPYGSALGDDELGLLLTDIKQTFFFHGAKFRGQQVRKLLVGGIPATWERLPALRDGLEVEVAQLPAARLLQNGCGDVAGWEACLGLAVLDPATFAHGLVPRFLRESRRLRRWSRWTAAAAAVAAFGFLVPGAALSRHAKLARLHEAEARRAIRSAEARLRAGKQDMIAHSIAVEQPAWDVLARELAAVVPPRAVLASFVVEHQGDVWQGSAQGQAVDPGQLHGLRLAQEMQRRLASSPLFLDPVVEPALDGDTVQFTIRFQVPVRGRLG